jgi:L-lactate permease
VVGLITAVVTGRTRAVPYAVRMMWFRGKKAVLTISIYLIIAGILADSGIAAALSQGLGYTLGPFAALATPWLAGAFGFHGSSNAANGLLMASQVHISENVEFREPGLPRSRTLRQRH